MSHLPSQGRSAATSGQGLDEVVAALRREFRSSLREETSRLREDFNRQLGPTRADVARSHQQVLWAVVLSQFTAVAWGLVAATI